MSRYLQKISLLGELDNRTGEIEGLIPGGYLDAAEFRPRLG
jgi:hypothetical protein